MDRERMIASTSRCEGVDSINIHDASTYALNTYPSPANPTRLNFTPSSPGASVCSRIALSWVSLLFVLACVCAHVCICRCLSPALADLARLTPLTPISLPALPELGNKLSCEIFNSSW